MRQLILQELDSEVIFAYGSLSECVRSFSYLFDKLSKRYSHCTLIADKQVHGLFGSLITKMLERYCIKFSLHIVPPGESTKTLLTANRCWTEMYNQGADRQSCVIALGGGMITDLAGFVAGCYMRGVDLINIPTTLLGMVDAAIGGKTGVNLEEGKNLIGIVHQPKYVFICPAFLKTLDDRNFRSGLAEVIKYGVIKDTTLFEYLENTMDSIVNREVESLQLIVERSVDIKAQMVKEDPFDKKNTRALLNWGHTFAHAIEAATGYTQYLHGEAVAIGMSCAGHVSHALGYAPTEFTERLDRLIRQAGLPLDLPDIPLDQIIELMKRDKKAQNAKINLIVAEKIGKVFVLPNIEADQIKTLLLARKNEYYVKPS